MTTWTDVTNNTNAWTDVTDNTNAWAGVIDNTNTWTEQTDHPTRVFSRDVFSHAISSSKTVFAVGTFAGIWDATSVPSTTWTAQ